MFRRLQVLSGLILAAIFASAGPGFADDAPAFKTVFQAAVRDLAKSIPANQSNNFNELLRQLPRDQNGYYIIEGDIALTDSELEDYLLGFASGAAPTSGNPELYVNLHDGEIDFYRNPRDRILTYSIERPSFPDQTSYDMVAMLMEGATSDWEQVCSECGIDFRLRNEADPAPANFVVEFKDNRGAFIARAFFPHDRDARRRITIDPSFLATSFDKRGVLRHELGHVLGYRHGHIGGVPGCSNEGGQWHPLTPYDPRSVMHYFCGGGGSAALMITDLDREGHRRLYGPTPNQ